MHIDYLGVGSMGQPMAERLLDGGHEVWLEDPMRPLLARQARRAASPKDLADATDTVVVRCYARNISRCCYRTKRNAFR